MSFSLVQKLRDIPFAFVDVETTGASADFGHRVIEMGIARVEGGRVVAEYSQLLDPQRRISAGVTALTGISQDMVAGQPTFAAELSRMLDLLRGAVVVGHNVRFDLGFLRKEFRVCRKDLVTEIGDVPVLDTVRIARRRFGRGGNGLQVLSRRLGMEPPVAHRALADVQTTVGVFERLLEPVGGWDLHLADALMAQGGKMGLLPVNPKESLLPLELEEALDLKIPVSMEYLDARQAKTCRVIRPMHVRRVGGELILVAWCELRQAQRTFKIERIVQLVRVEEGVVAVPATPEVERAEASAATQEDAALPDAITAEGTEPMMVPARHDLPETLFDPATVPGAMLRPAAKELSSSEEPSRPG